MGFVVLIAGAAGMMGGRNGIPGMIAEMIETTGATDAVIELTGGSDDGRGEAVMTGVRIMEVVVTEGIETGIVTVGRMLLAVALADPPATRKMSFCAPSMNDQEAWYPEKTTDQFPFEKTKGRKELPGRFSFPCHSTFVGVL